MSNSYGSASWASYLTFGWVNVVVKTGVERQVNLADTPALAKAEDTAGNTYDLLVNVNEAERAGLSHPLLRAVVVTFWKPLLVLQVLRVSAHFLDLVGPLLLQQVLVFQEAQDADNKGLSSAAITKGILAVASLVALGLFNIIFGSQLQFFQNRVSLRVGSALRGTLLHRCVKGFSPNSSPARDGGEGPPTVYNVISFDVGPNIEIIWIVLGLWIFPIQFASTLAVLFTQVHGAVFPGLTVILVAKLICAVLLVCDGHLRHRQLQSKDERLSRCAEGFDGIRTLQMLAWTQPFQERILEARAQELRVQQQRLWMQKMVMAIDYSLSSIVTLVTLRYYVIHESAQLKASVALPIVGLVNSLVGPFSQFPVWANQYLVWRSAYVRVNDYIGLAGQSRPQRPTKLSPPTMAANAPVASLRACSLTWATGDASEEDGEASSVARPLLGAKTAFSLQDLDLQVSGGDLVVLCGPQGQGKSSLLQGLLGEMAIKAGSAQSPAMARRAAEASDNVVAALVPQSMQEARELMVSSEASHRELYAVPYASQSTTLFTGTVRSNILFGARYSGQLYEKVLTACALETDLACMPASDLTEVAQGGATLSGGQRSRVCLARAVYRALLSKAEQPGHSPLVLLDDPFCTLDCAVARMVCRQLFDSPGLLAGCAVVVAAADPWWLSSLPGAAAGSAGRFTLQLAVLRGGRIVAAGSPYQIRELGFPELARALLGAATGDSRATGATNGDVAPALPTATPSNPQEEEAPPPNPKGGKLLSNRLEAHTQTPLTEKQQQVGGVLKQETREEGYVKWTTYAAYLSAVGPGMLFVLSASLASIMIFQNLCTLWIAYWTSEDKQHTFMYPWLKRVYDKPPEQPNQLWCIYAYFVIGFTVSNFAGHGVEIIGGIRAAHCIFIESLIGTLARPFGWWDANPTGRVLNRFSEDVEVMDLAVTNIIGVIFGAVLYFIGHSIVLAIANPVTLALLPVCAYMMEIYARYYRTTIRELQRIYLVCMSAVYQDMVEAILGQVTIRAFATSRQVFCESMDALDQLQRAYFAKSCLGLWISLRMSLIGYVLSTYLQLSPVLQYLGIINPQSAALVGFSISYSQGVIGIIQQFIMNYSDLEMQLVSLERLLEYAKHDQAPGVQFSGSGVRGGLRLDGVQVTYREGLPPAVSGVNLNFQWKEAVAMVGRTGAGKTSLMLAVLQLVPYDGSIWVGHCRLGDLRPADVRAHLVGVVPQQPLLFRGDLRWNLDPEGRWSDIEIWGALQAVGLQGCYSSERQGLATVVGGAGLALSQGQQQLLCAARVLLRRPCVVLLDEVTASLPPELALSTVSSLIRTFKDGDAVVVLVTHQEELVACCDRLVTVDAGHVVSDRHL